MPKFLKFTRMNVNGKQVGPIYVNKDVIVAVHVDVLSGMTRLVTSGTELILLKDTCEQVINDAES